MELYGFTELSNGWISFKSGIFITYLLDIYNKKSHFFYIWPKLADLNSPKYLQKMPSQTTNFFTILKYLLKDFFQIQAIPFNSS